jgi:hypothetical protein
MGRNRGWLRKLEHVASEEMESFELEDGSTYFYDRVEAFGELYVFGYDTELGNDPDLPEIWTKITQARDPELVLRRFRATEPTKAFIDFEKLYIGRTKDD